MRFIEADALQWQPEAQTYDLIVTCFFLDCFREDQLAHLVPVIAQSATVDAWGLVADFQIARTAGTGCAAGSSWHSCIVSSV